MIEVQAFDFTVVIGQHVNALAIRVVATAIFVDVGENLGTDGCGIAAITNRFRGEISLSFLSLLLFLLFISFLPYVLQETGAGERA